MLSQHGENTYPFRVMLVVMIGTFMATLDSSIVNVSLPTIMADFGANLDDIEWVVTGYMLAFAVLMPLTGWFRDRIGHKVLYLTALAIFTLGSLLCSMAWNLPSLIFARVIQALGGGAIAPTGMAMITDVFPPHKRGQALGVWGMGIILGPAIGPTLGGFLTNTLGWRSIFTVNVPVGIIGVMLGMALLREDRPPQASDRPFDVWGFVFLSLFLITLLLGLAKGEKEGWTSNYILACGALAAVGFTGFLLVESLTRDRIIDLSLFKIPIFSVSLLVNAVRSVALFGGIFLLPVFIQNLMGKDAIQTGLIMLPAAALMAVIIPFAGRMSDRVGPRWPTVIGLLLTAYFMYAYRNLDVNTSLWGLIWPMLIRSLGFALLIAPVMTAALNAIPKAKTAMASSMLNLIQQIGGSLGIAVLATVLSHRVRFHLDALGAAMTAGPAVQQFLRAVAGHAHTLGYSHAQAAQVARIALAQHTVQTATVGGFNDAFLFGTVIVLISVVPAMWLPTARPHHPDIEKAGVPE